MLSRRKTCPSVIGESAAFQGPIGDLLASPFRPLLILVILGLLVVTCFSIGCESKSQATASVAVDSSESASADRIELPLDYSSAFPAMTEEEKEALLAKCVPSVVDWRVYYYPKSGAYVGAGVVIDESGYALVNGHVYMQHAAGVPVAHLRSPEYWPCRLVAFVGSADAYLVKIAAHERLQPATLARCDAPQTGEPVLVIGQPKGEFKSVVWAYVGEVDVDNVQLMEIISPELGPGYSGSAVFNRNGEVIGLITVVEYDDEGNRLGARAVPIARLRRELYDVMESYCNDLYDIGFHVGSTQETRVVRVTGQGMELGVQVGDIVTRIGDREINDFLDYHLAIIELPSADPVEVALQRDEETITVVVTPTPPTEVSPVGPVHSGMRLRWVEGPYGTMTDFERRSRPENSAVVESIDLSDVRIPEGPIYLQFDGYVLVPADGEYLFDVWASELATVRVAGRQVAIIDPISGGREADVRPIKLKAGLHPITVDYSWIQGVRQLSVSYEGPGLEKQVIPSEALFTWYTEPPYVEPPDADEQPLGSEEQDEQIDQP